MGYFWILQCITLAVRYYVCVPFFNVLWTVVNQLPPQCYKCRRPFVAFSVRRCPLSVIMSTNSLGFGRPLRPTAQRRICTSFHHETISVHLPSRVRMISIFYCPRVSCKFRHISVRLLPTAEWPRSHSAAAASTTDAVRYRELCFLSRVILWFHPMSR